MEKKDKVKKPIYKKWWAWLVVIIVIIAACSDTEEEKEADKKKADKPEETVVFVGQEDFEAYAKNITGGSFIKSITVSDNKGSIEYFGNYEEYKAAKPESNVGEEIYTEYFETGDAISKILVSENVRLLRQFPDLTSTSMVLRYDGKTYSIDLDRAAANEYLGFKIEELSATDGSWQSKFVDPVVYDEASRQKFFDKFVTVK